MSHEIETMAFANEVPWHGLGNRVDTTVSVDEMLVAAGLDWNVQLHPTFAKVGDELIRVPNKSALIRDMDNKVLTTASDNWKPVQNRQVLEFFREWAEAGKCTLETAGSLRGGKLVWGLANIGRGFTTGGGRDAVKGYVLLASPHEAGKASSARSTKVRVVCANTMAAAVNAPSEAIYTQNHLRDFDFSKAREIVEAAHEDLRISELNAQILEQLTMSEYDTVRFFAKFFQPAPEGVNEETHVNTLLSDVEARNQTVHELLLSVNKAPGAVPGTGWGIINGVTYWADHVSGRSRDARLAKSWFGDNAKVKTEIERELLEMAA